jgi:voltage-gated potassium channel
MKKWKYLIGGLIVYFLVIVVISQVEKSAENSNIHSFSDGLWYAIVTLTTVGYGDFFPVTPGGKILGLTLIIGSIGILGFIIGEITTRFSQYTEKKKNGFWGTDFSNHYLIIGWSDFGRQVAEQIFNTGHKVAFIVNSKNDLEIVKDVFPTESCFCMFADYNNMEAYKKVNIEQSKGVFVNFPEDTETLVFVLNLKQVYHSADIVVTCKNPALKTTFRNAGIQHIVAQSEVVSRLVASYIFEPHVASLTEDLIATSVSGTDFDIQQYKITGSNPSVGKKYIDVFLDLKKRIGVVVIALVHEGKVIKNPDDDYLISENDYLILISDINTKQKLESEFGLKEGE